MEAEAICVIRQPMAFLTQVSVQTMDAWGTRPGSSLSSGRILSSSSQIFRGSDNARSPVRAESQQILVTCNQQIRFRKSGALQKHIVARITALLYRASNLHTDAARQNYLQRRCCPGLFPGELFR